MKKIILLFLLATSLVYAQDKVTVSVSSFSYSPVSQTIKVGDTVVFNVSGHPTLQVSEATYADNETTPLGGGFSFTNTGTFVARSAGIVYYVCTLHVGSFGMKGTITVEAPLSTPSTSISKNGIQLYPNPATSNVQLKFGQTTQVNSVSVVNAMGNEVLSQSLNTSLSSYSLDVSGLKSGIYHVIISTPEKKMMEKIVVE